MHEPNQDRQLFRFSDPRQGRIYKELKEIVGPGPAAFFRDACWLTANPSALQSTSHLVGHLLREIESALRYLFRPLAEVSAVTKTNESVQKSQKEEIRDILRSLKISEDSQEGRAWFRLAENLHAFAHRRGLDEPRPPGGIQEFWYQAQRLLEVLLQELRESFLFWIQLLDELLRKPQPTNEDLKRLGQEIPNNHIVRRYFFERLESAAWLEPLRAKGFFKQLPQPERNEEEGTIRFPPWLEGRYLARMAQHKPELVAQIIQEMDETDNVVALSDLVDILPAMPPEVSARLAEKAVRWAEQPYLRFYLPLPVRLGQLISHLAKGGKTEEAMAIARVLLAILPDPRQQQVLEPDDAYGLPPEPHARFDVWHYDRILKEHYPDLVLVAGLPAVELLSDLLEKAIRLSQSRDEYQGPEDLSYIWRGAIEDHPQNLGHTIRDTLVSGVRDTAELIVRSGLATVEEVVDLLESKPWKVFRRIALHILRAFSGQEEAGVLVAKSLTDRALFEDVGVRHEYVLLMREYFQRLTPEDQAQILGWVESGPKMEEWKRRIRSETGRQPTEEEETRYREVWQRDWLASIGPDNLPEEWKERYRNLCGKYGEPAHPDFPAYMIVSMGPASPKTAGELKAMSVEEIVEFLKGWRPADDVFAEPSPEGLASELSSVIKEDPGRFAADAPKFQGLDPTYVRAILSGLRDALGQDRSFEWGPVLDLCSWILSQPREIPGRQARMMHADPGWGWTRKAIAGLLSAGLEGRPGGIPIGFRQKVWAILKPLTEDPDPKPEYEQTHGGSNMDPATLSFNTTRGEAMHAVVLYALWVRRHLESEPESESRLQKGFEEMPEVREVLEAHLDPAQDPSLAIRAVYGWWFPWLALLDSEWAQGHARAIFPLDRESEAFFDAAWSTYVVYRWPYDNMLEILRPQYEHAMKQIGSRCGNTRWPADPDEKLAEHLMVFYWRGKLSLNDLLLVFLWEEAPNRLRAHAMEFIGRTLERNVPVENLDRLKQLWDMRLATAKRAQQPSDYKEEIAAFGWWFVSGKFDVKWAIKQLLESLRLAAKTNPDHMVLEHLAMTAQTHLQESVECLRMMVEGDLKEWVFYEYLDHMRKILGAGLQHPSTADEAKRIIHYLGSHGFLQFRDLLEG